ncbi:MAG TPA: non-homologous end-joining DNA ligase [Candidatus Limnocylindrales bacterium]|nr:non-homologous end-joining DNA ligase [Candidatus Limnocylindrales bacterium]
MQIAGREVQITNRDKVFFPVAGYTKGDLLDYYLAVAEGALRGVANRPMALKRFVHGADGEAFFQKRAPANRPPWIETAVLSFPSGRTAEEIVVRDAAQLAWVINLGCIDLNPHPVRSDDLDHPDELRIDLDPMPGVPWSQVREVALVAKGVLDDMGLTGWPKTSGSRGMHIYCRIERRWTHPEVRRAAVAFAREVERRAPAIATSKWWKEERHGVFLDYNQNAKDRTIASAYSVRPTSDARVSTPLRWDEVPDCEPEAFTLATVPARFAAIGDPGAGIDAAVGSLEALLELAARQEAAGLPDRRALASKLSAATGGGAPGPTLTGPPQHWSRPARRSRQGDRTDRPPPDHRAAGRDRARPDGEGGAGGARTLEVAPPRGGSPPRTDRHPGRRDARPQFGVVSNPGQPHARPAGAAPASGAARGRLRPVGRLPRPAVREHAEARSSHLKRTCCPNTELLRLRLRQVEPAAAERVDAFAHRRREVYRET